MTGIAIRYWIPRSSFSEAATFQDDKTISGIDSSTATISVNDQSIPALVVPSSFNGELAGYIKIEFDALDQWLEEQSQIIYHLRDPFHRVDVLPSGRRIKIEVDGVVLADTESEGGVMSLWETNFPPRWYLPRTAVYAIENWMGTMLIACRSTGNIFKNLRHILAVPTKARPPTTMPSSTVRNSRMWSGGTSLLSLKAR